MGNTATSSGLQIVRLVELENILREKVLPLPRIAPGARQEHMGAKKEFEHARYVEGKETQLNKVPKKATAFVLAATT